MVVNDLSIAHRSTCEQFPEQHPSVCKQLPEHKAIAAYRAAINIGRGLVASCALGLSCQSPCTSRRAPRQSRQPAIEEPPPQLRHGKSAPQNIAAQGAVEAVLVVSKSVPQNMDSIADRLSHMDASAMLVVCPTPAQDHVDGLFLHDRDASFPARGGAASVAGVVAHTYVERANTLPLVESTIPVSHEMPTGWEQAWLDGATAEGGLSGDSGINGGSRGQLPVCVFISSMAGDRKITKDCRWVLDFLRNKRVPFEVVDLVDQPEARQRMAQLSGDEHSPLPQVQFRDESISIDRLKDLEDHYELSQKLRTVIRRYAASQTLMADSPERDAQRGPTLDSTPGCGPPLAGQLFPPRALFSSPPPFGGTASAAASSLAAADIVAAAEVVAEAAPAAAEAAPAASEVGATEPRSICEPRSRSILDEARAQLESERARRQRCEAELVSLRRSTDEVAHGSAESDPQRVRADQ